MNSPNCIWLLLNQPFQPILEMWFPVIQVQLLDVWKEKELKRNVSYVLIVGVERYTDATVRYVPRFGGHGSIRFRYNMKKKEEIYYARFFSFILNRQ